MLQAPVEIKKYGNEKLLPNTLLSPAGKRSLGLVTPGSWRCSLGRYSIYLFFTFYMRMCTYAYTHVCQGKGCRGQLADVGSLLPSCRSQRLNSGPQSWWPHCPSLGITYFLAFCLSAWAPRRQAHAASLESFYPGAGIPRVHTFKECMLYAKYYVMWEFGIQSHFLYPVVMRIIP